MMECDGDTAGAFLPSSVLRVPLRAGVLRCLGQALLLLLGSGGRGSLLPDISPGGPTAPSSGTWGTGDPFSLCLQGLDRLPSALHLRALRSYLWGSAKSAHSERQGGQGHCSCRRVQETPPAHGLEMLRVQRPPTRSPLHFQPRPRCCGLGSPVLTGQALESAGQP